MHVQARALPNLSPDDLAKFLRVLAPDADAGRDGINIEGSGGAAVESGGHFVFTVTHGRLREAWDRLTEVGYRVEWTDDLYAEAVPPDASQGRAGHQQDPNQPGVLLGIVERAKASELAAGRNIDCAVIGAVTDEPERFFVQVTFAGSTWRDDRPKHDD